MICWEVSTNVGYPCHEYIGGKCCRCGEVDPDQSEEVQEELAQLAAETVAAGGYVQEGSPVPYSRTYYDADGRPVVRELPTGWERV